MVTNGTNITGGIYTTRGVNIADAVISDIRVASVFAFSVNFSSTHNKFYY